MTISEVMQIYPELKTEMLESLFQRRAQLKKLEETLVGAQNHYKELSSQMWNNGFVHDAILLETSLVGQDIDKRIKEVQDAITNITAYLYDNGGEYRA